MIGRASAHDILCVGLVLLPAIAGAIASAAGATALATAVAASLAALAGVWAYAAFIYAQRQRRADAVERAWARVRAAAGLPSAAPLRGVAREQSLADRIADESEGVARRVGEGMARGANLAAMFDAAASPIVASDASGRIVACNKAAEEFFVRSGDTVIGRPIESVFTHAEVLGQHAAALAGRSTAGQVRVPRPEGQRVFQVFTNPVTLTASDGTTGRGAAVTLRDITELARADQLKTDFVANASHELRTPLSSIRGAVDTLADGAWDDDAMRGRLAQIISTNVTRLEEMVRDLLDLSRLETPDAPVDPEQIDLHELFETLGEGLAAVTKERNLTLSLEAPAGASRLFTDRALLTLILRNLLDNATKFAHEGTGVRVVAEPLPPLPRAPRGGLRLRVIDRGAGIPLGQQQRIFERFYQVDPSRAGFHARRGTGLGLAIVKHAVKALGGTITVESVWKEGTTMTVELPGALAPGGAPGPG
ncbi:MAG TPA: ATP-binding protein [Phycisphaerales bacterium]|nr:ATP-binding protein [Phycisphaerales bacterium]